MTTTSLILVLAASFIHATWNLLVKQVGGGTLLLWVIAAIAMIFYAPLVVALIFLRPIHPNPLLFVLLFGSVVLHLVYFVILQRGYEVGDLSVVYPLARGTGPTLSALGGILLFAERPSLTGIFGIVCILFGIFLIATPGRRIRRNSRIRPAVIYGLLTGICIASYTLWDKYCVGIALVHPLILDYSSQIFRAAVLAPIAARRRAGLAKLWRSNRARIVWIALLNPLSFILVLTAMIDTPVSYVAPARELSIVIGVFFGARLLAEEGFARRLVGASFMVCGIALLAIG